MNKMEIGKELYQYKACGLDNIYLVGGVTRRKTPRGEAIHIEDVKGLHAAIGQMLVQEKKKLNGRELRFLRHEINLTQENLGALLGTEAQNVARWEKGKTKVPGPADRLIRLLYREHASGNIEILEPLRELAELDELLNEDETSPVIFNDGEHGWEIACAA
jgi:DNA-binding transcriptional regulator YiaG